MQLRGHRVVVAQTNTQRTKNDAIAALGALGETTLTAKRLKQVTDPKVACLLLQAGVATAIPDCFASRTAVTCIDLSHPSAVTVIGNDFLRYCTSLTKLDLSGLQAVTSIGSGFLYGCTALSTVDLSGLQAVTTIGDSFLVECTSLSTVDMSALQAVTWIGDGFLWGCKLLSTVDVCGLRAVTTVGHSFLHIYGCPALKTLHGKDKCSNAVLRVLPDHLRQ